MALLDTEREVIVIRVVYDGPAQAGKTTSLRALAGSLGRDLQTPSEHEGRTLYFDWMDYTGGRFEGYQIRCQIVSVPGQLELVARRRQLLQDADVIVCVADTSHTNIEMTTHHLRELPAIVAGLPPPPVGVILQANKRDLPDAIQMSDLRDRIDQAGLRVGVVESVASTGSGIRETFVFAVRLALDRVRELLRSQTMPRGRPEIDDANALLASMKAADVPGTAAIAATAANADGRVNATSQAVDVPGTGTIADPAAKAKGLAADAKAAPGDSTTVRVPVSKTPRTLPVEVKPAPAQAPRPFLPASGPVGSKPLPPSEKTPPEETPPKETQIEPSSLADTAAPALAQVLKENELAAFAPWRAEPSAPQDGDGPRPRPPDPSVPSGSIWPPVEGRLILHEASSMGMSTHGQLRNGAWAAGMGNGWRTYSSEEAWFSTLDQGRAVLIQWARLHAVYSELLSPRRCIVLADAGDGGWRLWQILRIEQSLRDSLPDIERSAADEAAGHLLTVATALAEMAEKLDRASSHLPCTLDTAGFVDARPIYIGLMPQKASDDAFAARGPQLLSSELAQLLGGVASERRAAIRSALQRHQRLSVRPQSPILRESLRLAFDA